MVRLHDAIPSEAKLSQVSVGERGVWPTHCDDQSPDSHMMTSLLQRLFLSGHSTTRGKVFV